jgi:hypothetical protein
MQSATVMLVPLVCGMVFRVRVQILDPVWIVLEHGDGSDAVQAGVEAGDHRPALAVAGLSLPRGWAASALLGVAWPSRASPSGDVRRRARGDVRRRASYQGPRYEACGRVYRTAIHRWV